MTINNIPPQTTISSVFTPVNSSFTRVGAPTGTNNYSKNDNKLKEKIIGDVLSALTITFFISPCLVIVDKSVVQRTVGTHTITQSIKETMSTMIKHPIKYLRSPMFLMMWGVYASTYSTANVLKTLIEHDQETSSHDAHRRSNGDTINNSEYTKVGSFLATTFVNSSLSLVKDRAYATMLGKPSIIGNAPKSFPLLTYGIWGLRDLTVIGSGFVLPEIMGKVLQEKNPKMDRKEALSISQMICPVAAQFVATPLQLLGLDIYNRPMKNMNMYHVIKERYNLIYTNFLPSLTVRFGRIIPGLGIGGVGNLYLRDSWRDMISQQENILFTSYSESNTMNANRAKQLVRTFTMKNVHTDE